MAFVTATTTEVLASATSSEITSLTVATLITERAAEIIPGFLSHLGTLSLVVFAEEVISRSILEVAIVVSDKALAVLILYMLDDKLRRAESLVANLARVLPALLDAPTIVLTILMFHFDEDFIFLRINQFLLRSLLKDLLSLLDVILLKL